MSSPRVKVCGITRPEDGRLAVSLGASYLGFILYPKSPRAIELKDFQSLHNSLPDSFRVMVDVRPSLETVKNHVDVGFDFFQIHLLSVLVLILSFFHHLVHPLMASHRHAP